ncbi:MAG: SDR family NAD(P)-dependent oxidoreductase [Alphaproteobacteria bacterium]
MNNLGNELAGQVAFVTGGARNIGRSICLDLAAGGAAIAVNALTSAAEAEALAAEIEAAGGKAMACIGDIADPAAATRMIGEAVARFGKLTILVNNAAVRGLTPIEEMTLDAWRRVCGPTVEGAMLCTQAAVPHIRAAGGGSIVTLGGIAGHAGVKGRTHVAAAKAALVGFTKSLAHEVGGDSITANIVVPGHIETVRGASAGAPPAYNVNYLVEGRRGRPEEVAAVVRALCGPAGRYVTGQTVHVNGGAYLP